MSNNKQETTEVEYVELGTELSTAREGFIKLTKDQQKMQFILNPVIRKMLLAASASQSKNMDPLSVMNGIKEVRKDIELLQSIDEDELARVETLNNFVELIFKFTTVFPSFKMEEELSQEGFDFMTQLMIDQQLLVNWATKEEQESTKELIDWSKVSDEATQYAAEKIAKQSDAKQTEDKTEVEENNSETEDKTEVEDVKVKTDKIKEVIKEVSKTPSKEKVKRDPHKTRPMFKGRVPM